MCFLCANSERILPVCKLRSIGKNRRAWQSYSLWKYHFSIVHLPIFSVFSEFIPHWHGSFIQFCISSLYMCSKVILRGIKTTDKVLLCDSKHSSKFSKPAHATISSSCDIRVHSSSTKQLTWLLWTILFVGSVRATLQEASRHSWQLIDTSDTHIFFYFEGRSCIK